MISVKKDGNVWFLESLRLTSILGGIDIDSARSEACQIIAVLKCDTKKVICKPLKHPKVTGKNSHNACEYLEVK